MESMYKNSESAAHAKLFANLRCTLQWKVALLTVTRSKGIIHVELVADSLQLHGTSVAFSLDGSRLIIQLCLGSA